jgi:hypothetical protein
MKKLLTLVKNDGELAEHNQPMESGLYSALKDGYSKNYFANMTISQVDSNHIEVFASDRSVPITLTELGEQVLNELNNPPKPIGFRQD